MKIRLSLALLALPATVSAQQPAPAIVVLQPDRVFDGESMRAGWIVVVRGERIDAAGPAASTTVPAGSRARSRCRTTLMPGMIEGHSHLLLHPYARPCGTIRCCATARVARRSRRQSRARR